MSFCALGFPITVGCFGSVDGGDGCGGCGGGGSDSEACGEYKIASNPYTTKQNKYITVQLSTLKLW